jgi:hypothetical protein
MKSILNRIEVKGFNYASLFPLIAIWNIIFSSINKMWEFEVVVENVLNPRESSFIFCFINIILLIDDMSKDVTVSTNN